MSLTLPPSMPPPKNPSRHPLQVAAMKKVAEAKQVVVAQAKVECEELLVEIVQDKRVADEQEKQVGGRGVEEGARKLADMRKPSIHVRLLD